MRLDVQVKGKQVAQLYRERDEYVLRYTPGATAGDFVSLTMPVREEPWRWPRDLHPFFRQNLPEGYLLGVIREEFGSLLDGTDLSLLAVVGGTSIGRVTVTPEGAVPHTDITALDVKDILQGDNTAARFEQLVRDYARAAISGAVPKFIAPDDAGGSRFIIKGSDNTTPFLGFNEFYSMRVLERLGKAPVAKCQMSVDGRALVVERFDVDKQGVPALGVEDACSLLGLPPNEKYASTTEKAFAATSAYWQGTPEARQQVERFAWHLLTNYVVRNADCHTKNIAVYYSDRNDVAYTPIYDIITTQAYARYADNPPGLSVSGRKTWTPGHTLEKFFKARLGIAPRQYHEMVEALCDSAVGVGREMIAAQRNDSRWSQMTANMLHAWNDGMESLRSPKKNVGLRPLTAAIQAADLPNAEPALHERSIIGRSPLLGQR
jgi:serine/threonine-protein kinase HipA